MQCFIFVKTPLLIITIFLSRYQKGIYIAKIISIVNQKGGTGKPAYAANLGVGLAGTEVQLVNAMSREFVLKQIINQYDYILIECMPFLGMLTINTLVASDEVLILVEAIYLTINGLQRLLKTIGKVRRQISPKLEISGILFTMVDAHTNDARNNMELL